MQSGFDFCIFDKLFQMLGISSVHELYHIFYNRFGIQVSSSAGDPFPFCLSAGIYCLAKPSCLHNLRFLGLR